MKRESDQDEAIVRYLLGELSGEEQARIEEQFFADDALYERVRATEGDLIAAYVRGDMSAADRERFERPLAASAELRERVESARALARVLEEAPGETRQGARSAEDRSEAVRRRFARPLTEWHLGLRVAAACVGLALVAAVAWLVYDATRERERPELAGDAEPKVPAPSAENLSPPQVPQDRNAPLNAAPPKPRVAPGVVAAVTLVADPTRGGAADAVATLGLETRSVAVTAPLAERDYRTYRMSLRTPAGETLWSRSGLRARRAAAGATVTATVPAERLVGENFVVEIAGEAPGRDPEPLAEFVLRARREPAGSTR